MVDFEYSRTQIYQLRGGLFQYNGEIAQVIYHRISSPVNPAECEPKGALIPFFEAVDQDVNVYSGPGTDYSLIETVITGGPFPSRYRKIVGRNADTTWWQISTDYGSGWVAASEVEVKNPEVSVPILETPVPPPTPVPVQPMVKAYNGDVNIHRWPGTEQEIVGLLPNGQSRLVIGRNADSSWWQVPVDGSSGWVAASLTELINPDNVNIPVVENLPPEPPSGNCPSSPGDKPEIDEHEQWMLDAINQFRAENSKQALVWDEGLNKAADWFSGSSYTGTHIDSMGNDINARVMCFGFEQGATEVLANNIGAQKHEGAEEAYYFWTVTSPSHRKQLELPNIRVLGIGHSQNPLGAGFGWVWVVNLGPLP